MTRVLVDAWELRGGTAQRGISRFLAALLPRLADRADLQVAVIRPGGDPPGPAPAATRYVRRRVPRGRIRTSSAEHLLRLPGELAATPHDVLLSPGTLPPLASPRPFVQVIHDLAPLVLDHEAYSFERRRWRLLAGRVRRAAAVVAVSRFAADEAAAVLGLDRSAIEVVHHGVEPRFRPDGPEHDAGGPYVVTVTAADPRKGLDETAAVARALAGSGRPHRLVVAGHLPEDLRARLARTGGDRLVLAGFVPDLPALLRGADAAMTTSRYEGFGFPPLEAMACGTPVVAFDNTAVGEVVGDGGILVPDGAVDAMAAELDRLLADPQHRTRWRRRGLERARAFDWGDAAARYAGILTRAAGRGR